MAHDKDCGKDVSEMRTTKSSYEPPRVVKSRRLAEVTGQVAPVPSGTPVQQQG
jgi:hypothetical protein